MRKNYTPASPLHPTYVGPLRIIELYPQGACLKDVKTGEISSAHFMNLRKISLDEFITLLPTDFDSDILKNLGQYRYSRNHLPDPPSTKPQEVRDTDQSEETEEEDETVKEKNNEKMTEAIAEKNFSNLHARKLRSGKTIHINVYTLPAKYKSAKSAHYAYVHSKTAKPTQRSCLTRRIITPRTPWATIEQTMGDNCYVFYTKNRMPHPENHHKTKYKSNFQSHLRGYLTVNLASEEDNGRRVRFSELTVKFY